MKISFLKRDEISRLFPLVFGDFFHYEIMPRRSISPDSGSVQLHVFYGFGTMTRIVRCGIRLDLLEYLGVVRLEDIGM